jgi:glucose/mannose-6-phosphate isomerase
MELTDPATWKDLDSLGIGKALDLFPDQISECFKQAYSANIPQFEPSAVIVSGMGGSSNAAKILQGLYEDELKVPFEVYNDYGLPAWVNENTLVVVNSYSGNTEETLSAVAAAEKVKAKVLGVATGGKIGEMIVSGAISGSIINPGNTNPSGFPKSGLGVSFGGLTGALAKGGLLPVTENDINASMVEIKDVRTKWDAKEIAVWLNGNLPVLFGGKPFVGALNAGRNAMCEISRNFTQFYDFPEVDHVMVEAMAKPEVFKEKAKYIFFESNLNNDRVLKRYEVTAQIMTEQGLDYKTYKLKSASKLSQALEIAHYSAWLGFYISILQVTDPGPEPWIIKLKQALAQPVH